MIEERFHSLAEAIQVLSRRYPVMQIDREAIDPGTGEHHSAFMPRFLFRGESGIWDTTVSSMARLRQGGFEIFDSIPAREHEVFKNAVNAICQRVCSDVKNFFNIDPLSASGFVQHYELFTELIDFTVSLQMGVGFAVGNPASWATPRIARICVADLSIASDRATVADLTGLLSFASRPVWQGGYGLFAREYDNLKDAQACRELGLLWYEVEVTPEEAASYALLSEVLDAHRDPVAGYIQIALDELSCEHKQWPDPLARFLSERVPAAPFIGRALGGDKYDLVCAEEAGIPYDERAERELSRRLWSSDYPQVKSRLYNQF